MIILKSKQLVMSIVMGVFIAMSLHAEKTRLQNDKLLFSNGGGFENESDVISVLNIGKSGTYLSKGVNVMGDYITIDNDIQDLSGSTTYKTITDRIPLSLFNSQIAVFNGLRKTTFPTDMQFLVGDFTKAYMVMNAQKIGAIKVSSPATGPKVHLDDVLYIQKNKAPTYIGNVTNAAAGETYMPAMSIFGQLVINGVLADVKRVGINTKDPNETLSIVGDLKVDGKLNASAGVFRPKTYSPTVGTQAVSTTWTTIAKNTIKVKYVPYSVFIVGHANMTNRDPVEARIRISQKEFSSSTTFTDFTPAAPYPEEEEGSWVKFTCSGTQFMCALAPCWTGVLPAYLDHPEIEKEYQIEVQTKFTNPRAWSGAEYKTDEGGTIKGSRAGSNVQAPGMLTVLGLPTASPAKPVDGSVSNAKAYSQDTLFTFQPVVGNFLTKDLVSFSTDGLFLDSSTGLNMMYSSGTKFKPFKASKLSANNIYEQQLLKVYSGTRNDSVFKIVNPSDNWIKADSWMGFNPGVSYAEVSHNIQSIYGSGPIPLWFTQANIGDGALTMNPDVAGGVDSVGIGTSPVSGVALTVQGNVSFTGQYSGSYGRILSKLLPEINPNDPSNGTTWIALAGKDASNNPCNTTISGVTVSQNSSVLMMFTTRIQNTNNDYVTVKLRIKVSDGTTTWTPPEVQCVLSGGCSLNSLFSQFAMDFEQGKSYTISVEYKAQDPDGGGTGKVQEFYDANLLALILPSTSE